MKKYFVSLLFCISISPLLAQESPGRNLQGGEKEALLLLVFLGTECPISQDYVGVINKIGAKYGYKVKIRGLIPDMLTKKQVTAFRENYQARFPVELDKDFSLSDQYKITVTPEVILLDPSQRIRYRGAIDNWYFELGQHRQVVTENYLINAIDALIEGNDVNVKETEPVGCPLPRRK